MVVVPENIGGAEKGMVGISPSAGLPIKEGGCWRATASDSVAADSVCNKEVTMFLLTIKYSIEYFVNTIITIKF